MKAYKQGNTYKLVKDTIRKYYKYVSATWTQPVLSNNGVLGGSEFAVEQSPTANTNTYTMFTSNGNYMCPVGQSFILYHPLGMNITKFYRTTSSVYYVRYPSMYYLSFSNDGINWTDEISYSVPYQATTTTDFDYEGYYKYTKIRPISPYQDVQNAIGRVEVTATALTVQESTSSDYDFYKDVDVYKAFNI